MAQYPGQYPQYPQVYFFENYYNWDNFQQIKANYGGGYPSAPQPGFYPPPPPQAG